jgi:hypothetical protein
VAFWRPRHPISDSDLSAFIDGALGAAARARVDAHVASCAACREVLAGLRAVRQALGALPRAEAPRSFALREADVRPAPRPAMTSLGRAPALLGGLATAAFLAFGVLVGVDLTGGTADQQPADPGTTAAYDAARGDATRGEQPPVADATTPAAAGPTSLEIAGETPEPDVAATPELDAGEAPALDAGAALEPDAGETPEPDAAATPELDAGEAPKDDVYAADGERAPSASGAEDDRSGLRAAEGALAGVALVAGASFLLVRRRRRA